MTSLLTERHEVVLADALQYEERRRAFAAIGNKVRAPRPDRVSITRPKSYLLLGLAQEDESAARLR